MNNTAVPVLITRLCLRCGHEWIARQEKPPRTCPKCKSPYWDKKRRKEK